MGKMPPPRPTKIAPKNHGTSKGKPIPPPVDPSDPNF
jgi:hypothetical protein